MRRHHKGAFFQLLRYDETKAQQEQTLSRYCRVRYIIYLSLKINLAVRAMPDRYIMVT